MLQFEAKGPALLVGQSICHGGHAIIEEEDLARVLLIDFPVLHGDDAPRSQVKCMLTLRTVDSWLVSSRTKVRDLEISPFGRKDNRKSNPQPLVIPQMASWVVMGTAR
jgi:hypothetical protein